mmetsp:Transcript_23478/g.44173  ORF Transcript_23478/g.44173 Transcript_23478/m.44173 type:complete len:286 (+) Transcript_23478:1337-2194(+)
MLVPFDLAHDLLLVGPLQLLQLVLVLLVHLLESLLVLHLHVVLLLTQELEFVLVLLEVLRELLRLLLDLLGVVHVLEPQLVLVVERKFVNLVLELLHERVLLLQITLGDQHLLAPGHGPAVGLAAGEGPLVALVLDAKHAQVSHVVRHEQELVVVGDPHSGDGASEAGVLEVLSAKGEGIRPHAAGFLVHRSDGKHGVLRVGQDNLAQRHVGVADDLGVHVRELKLPDHLLGADRPDVLVVANGAVVHDALLDEVANSRTLGDVPQVDRAILAATDERRVVVAPS